MNNDDSSNILLVDYNLSNDELTNINFNICLFSFIFVVYFLYVFLKDIFHWRS